MPFVYRPPGDGDERYLGSFSYRTKGGGGERSTRFCPGCGEVLDLRQTKAVGVVNTG